MKDKYTALFEPIKLGNGVEVSNRFAMAPMLVFGSNKDDTVGQEDLDYFKLRNNVGGLLISGAAAVSEEGLGTSLGPDTVPLMKEFGEDYGQLTIFDDAKVEGLSKLAEVMKEQGNKAILQIHNAGREAIGAAIRYGHAYAPTAMDFSWLDYEVKELSGEQVEEVIEDYGQATRRAIEAGFDGVEIHGANHYLIQQFFSAFSNRRTDKWGGESVEERMAFPLAVVDEVQKIVEEYGNEEFIVGYRLSPEEVHGENIGYTVDDVTKLVDEVVKKGIDFIHVSTGQYDQKPTQGEKDEPMIKTISDAVNHRVPVIVAGGVPTPEQALDVLNYADIIGLGAPALYDPEFAEKIETGHEDKIHKPDVSGRLDELKLPKKLELYYGQENTSLPPIKGFK